MAIKISLDGRGTIDDLLSLRNSLAQERELRGRIELIEQPEKGSTLGSLIDAISVAMVPGGAVTVLAASTVAWIRQRTTNVSLKFETDGGARIEIDAKRIRSASAEEVRDMVIKISKQLDPESKS